MTDQTIGLFLMGAAIVTAGALIGFDGAKRMKRTIVTIEEIPLGCQFPFYVGSLMTCSGTDFGNAILHAFVTILFGLLLTAIFSALWYSFFIGFRKFAKWYTDDALPRQ